MGLEDLKNKKIAILGFGKEGKSTLNFLISIGVKNITILDKSKVGKLSYFTNQASNIKSVFGYNYLNNLDIYDYIFKTPGISPYNEKLIKYKDKFLSGTQIFFDNYKGKIIAITGTKGKSTISTLLYKALEKAGYKVKLVGNIGTPVLDEIDITSPLAPLLRGEGDKTFDYVIYEMSSYMLETLKPKTYVSIINNIYDCHLDWHNGRDNYKKAKLNILDNAEYKLINSELKTSIKDTNFLYFGEKGNYTYRPHTSPLLIGEGIEGSFTIDEKNVFKDENILLEGTHNRINISGVIGILDIISKEKNNLEQLLEGLKYTLKTFSGLPHRLENIGTKNGITFIDDAIAVTQESTIVAINTYGTKIGTIFLGGQDTGLEFSLLEETLKKYNISNIVLFPDSGNKIFGSFSENLELDKVTNLPGKYSPKILKTNTMKKAIKFAFENTEKGKICLLSCASPSFSLWQGFEEKGDSFKMEMEEY